MILVYGLRDPSINRLLVALQAAGATFQFLDIATLDQAALQVRVGLQGVEGEIRVAGQSMLLGDIRAIYTRPVVPVNPYTQALHQRLVEWLDITSALVVSRPATMGAHASGPLQTQLIGQAGFAVPTTLVTSDEEEVRAFCRLHGQVVRKTLRGGHSIVTELTNAGLPVVQQLTQLPTQFQAHVPGVDVRVHVVGRQVFAAEIRDARTTEVTPTILPAAVAAQCVAVSQAMDLPMSGIDLRLRPDGEYVCCEVHPMPAYSDCEAQSGLPMAAALAELLQQADGTCTAELAM